MITMCCEPVAPQILRQLANTRALYTYCSIIDNKVDSNTVLGQFKDDILYAGSN